MGIRSRMKFGLYRDMLGSLLPLIALVSTTFAKSKSFQNLTYFQAENSYSPRLRLRRLSFNDPKTVEIKLVDRSKSALLPGGILYISQYDYSLNSCDFFLPDIHPELSEVNITRIEYHFDNCMDVNRLGNILGDHYGYYALAIAAGIPYTMTCGDGEDSTKIHHMVLPGTVIPQISVLALLQVHLTEPGPLHTDASGKVVDAAELCAFGRVPYWESHSGVDLVSDVIREDMWRVAEADKAENFSFVPDDAVIHLRLGDVLYSVRGKHQRHQRDGLLPHLTYSLLLKQAALEKGPIETISIVTQPFGGSGTRAHDMSVIERSKMIAYDLVKHLQEQFPNAIVTIHNGVDEPPSRAYARLIRAKIVCICGPATFCTFPVLGNRDGIGYILNGDGYLLNPWAARAAMKYDNIRIFGGPTLGDSYIESLSDHDLLVWLNHQDPGTGYILIREDPAIRYPGIDLS
jgi:hypothetical protein